MVYADLAVSSSKTSSKIGAVSSSKIGSRQIAEADLANVLNLLVRGFAADRSRDFWEFVLDRLGKRQVPKGFPRFGYILESESVPVGVILQIFSSVWSHGIAKMRCCISSVYVDPEFRVYAPLFELQALKYDNVTVLDLAPHPDKHALVEAGGYMRINRGIFVAIPMLTRYHDDKRVRIMDGNRQPNVPFDAHDYDLLRDHAEYECFSLWCVTPECAYPFVFRMRKIKRILKCAQLIYCRDLADLVRFARPIGLYLARRGYFSIMADSNGPIDGLVGKYLEDKMPRFFRGPDRPRLGDLAYTEIALFGI